jgi:AraC-like DNA-binding protein
MMHEQLTISERFPVIARRYNYGRFTYTWHFHPEYEIIFVKEGRGDRFVADSMEPFTSGDLILLGHNIPHYMQSAPEYYLPESSERTTGVIIQFESDFMSHAMDKYADMSAIGRLLANAARGLHFTSPVDPTLIRKIEELPDCTGLERIVHLLLLLNQMAACPTVRPLASSYYCYELPAFADRRLNKILAYLRQHHTHPLRLDDIAAMVSMNASAFSRYFKGKAGKPFVEYLQDLRVGHACKLLIGSSYDVAQVGLECGFNTLSHFNRIFKLKTGLTPTEYRKRFLPPPPYRKIC